MPHRTCTCTCAQVLPLCTRKKIDADYKTLSKASLRAPDGSDLHLYSSLLALLLRLSSAKDADSAEIARRTREVRRQCERSPGLLTRVAGPN